MGQQQLLLLVLGIVIVGLAVVVGINAFGENQKRANADAMVNDALRIASDIQAYALKPAQFGGSGGWSELEITTDFLEEDLGYSGDPYDNVNGSYSLEQASAGDDVIIQGENTDQTNVVQVRVCGVTSTELVTNINYDGSTDGEPDACPDST